LAYMAEPPSHNTVVAGRWFDAKAGEVSFEEGVMETLGLELGDRVGFDIAGRIVEADLTSVRAVAWDSMQVNFFAILSPALLATMPQTWITAYHQAAAGKPLDRELRSEERRVGKECRPRGAPWRWKQNTSERTTSRERRA